MKAAWIGVLGAIIGALVSVFAAELVQVPRDGTFLVEHNAITEYDVDSTLRDQVTRFPVTLRISHVDGPAVQNISVVLKSTANFENFETTRGHEDAKTLLGDNSLRVDIPILRKGGTLQYRLISLGSPRVSVDVTHSDGKLISQRSAVSEQWYENEQVIIAIMILGIMTLFLLVIYFLRKEIAEYQFNYTDGKIILAVVVLSFLPLGFGITDAIVVVLLLAILKRIRSLEQNDLSEEEQTNTEHRSREREI